MIGRGAFGEVRARCTATTALSANRGMRHRPAACVAMQSGTVAKPTSESAWRTVGLTTGGCSIAQLCGRWTFPCMVWWGWISSGGCAGQVWLCRERKTGKIVALKKLKKSEMVRRGQVDHVKAERNVLAEVHNPYIVRLYYSFQVSPPAATACSCSNCPGHVRACTCARCRPCIGTHSLCPAGRRCLCHCVAAGGVCAGHMPQYGW